MLVYNDTSSDTLNNCVIGTVILPRVKCQYVVPMGKTLSIVGYLYLNYAYENDYQRLKIK